ncbi:MAG TPA: hypothetical protein VMV47_10805 [Bacteroidales bacterium]|nr:hypothetical protein [Bacteroidales bacterium]
MNKRTSEFTPLQGARGAEPAKKNILLLILKLLVSLVLYFIISLPSVSQSINYSNIFGTDWDKALAFERDNRNWMQPVLEHNKIPYDYAIAVIFPELVRYSALRDKMEITLLKALYINLGEQYANFSIGQYQIKPSFAETIHSEGPSVLGRRSGIRFKQPGEFESISYYRKSIVVDLEKPETEFNYVVAFYKICEKKYRINSMDEIHKLKFLATAYNFGIDKSAEQIELMIDTKYFNTKLFKTENYSYADVALFWYLNNKTGSGDGRK